MLAERITENKRDRDDLLSGVCGAPIVPPDPGLLDKDSGFRALNAKTSPEKMKVGPTSSRGEEVLRS